MLDDLPGIHITMLRYRLSLVVFSKAGFALLGCKSLNLLLVLSFLAMKREIEKNLADAIGQHHGKTLITKDALIFVFSPCRYRIWIDFLLEI